MSAARYELSYATKIRGLPAETQVGYRQFLSLCERWSRDQSKRPDRDLSLFVRQAVLKKFPLSEATTIGSPQEQEQLDKLYRQLNDLANDRFRKQFQNERIFGALGLTYDKIHVLNSDDFAEAEYRRKQLPLVRLILLKIQNMFGKVDPSRDFTPFKKQ